MAQPPQAPKCAERRDPLRACAFHTEQQPAIGMAGYRTGFDGLARQRVGCEHGMAVREGDAVAAMSDVIDDEMFTHGARR